MAARQCRNNCAGVSELEQKISHIKSLVTQCSLVQYYYPREGFELGVGIRVP